MNRRKFVLSWGRKIFFGMSWPLTSMIGLIYLKSYIIPHSGADLAYFILTCIGHYGLLTALVYFLLYAPVVLLMPTYYISRFWSLFLVLALNLLVLIDGVIFSAYHLHGYSFLSHLLMNGGMKYFQDSSALNIFIPCGAIFISVVLWMRGEIIWRAMQRRFSNPVKNWYLVFIFICLALGQTVYHFGNIHSKIATLFPLNFTFARANESKIVDHRSFYYPSGSIDCLQKKNSNLIVMTLNKWQVQDFSAETMPNVYAMRKHAHVFNSHYSVSKNPTLGEFALQYSLPGNYLARGQESSSALLKELGKRQYEILNFSKTEDFFAWMTNRPKDQPQPFYVNLQLNLPIAEADVVIQEGINLLQKEDLLSGTTIVMTGLSSGQETHPVPFMLMTTEREYKNYTHITSHYDVMPTLMDEVWGCKNTFAYGSIGHSLYDVKQDWLFIADENDFEIIDFKNSMMTVFENGKLRDIRINGGSNQPRRELVFEALKLKTRFSKPK